VLTSVVILPLENVENTLESNKQISLGLCDLISRGCCPRIAPYK